MTNCPMGDPVPMLAFFRAQRGPRSTVKLQGEVFQDDANPPNGLAFFGQVLQHIAHISLNLPDDDAGCMAFHQLHNT